MKKEWEWERAQRNDRELWGQFRHRTSENRDKRRLAAGCRLNLSLSPWFGLSLVPLWQGVNSILLTRGFHHLQHGVWLWRSNTLLFTITMTPDFSKPGWEAPSEASTPDYVLFTMLWLDLMVFISGYVRLHSSVQTPIFKLRFCSYLSFCFVLFIENR